MNEREVKFERSILMYLNSGNNQPWRPQAIQPMQSQWYYNWNPYFYNWNLAQPRNIVQPIQLQDYGANPLVVNIEEAVKQNNNYRLALWTGKHFQVTLMTINVGEDIGLEVHPETDQFIRIEEGQGLVQMGDSKDHLDFQVPAGEDFAIMVPAGKWHNITNIGHEPLKVYAIYAPPEHPFGTVQANR